MVRMIGGSDKWWLIMTIIDGDRAACVSLCNNIPYNYIQ